jgi:hypothetical protein
MIPLAETWQLVFLYYRPSVHVFLLISYAKSDSNRCQCEVLKKWVIGRML